MRVRVYLSPKGDFPHETFHGISHGVPRRISWSLVGFSLELPTVVCFYGSFHGKPISSHDEIYPPAGCIGTFPGTYPIRAVYPKISYRFPQGTSHEIYHRK